MCLQAQIQAKQMRRLRLWLLEYGARGELAWARDQGFGQTEVLPCSAQCTSRGCDVLRLCLPGWRSSLADMREALGPPGGASEGGPSSYMDAAKAASRQLQALGPLVAAIGQAQLLQQRTNSELQSISR